MGKLIGIAGRWLGRNLLSLLLIVGVLATFGFIQKEIKSYSITIKAMDELKRGKDRIESDTKSKVLEVHARIDGKSKGGATAVVQRISEVDQEISVLKSKLGASAGPTTCILIGGDACTKYLDSIRKSGALQLLMYERDALVSLKSVLDSRSGGIELERRRRLHVLIYAQLQGNQAQLSQLQESTPFWERHSPWSSANQQIRFLERERDALYAQNQAAHDAYVRQESTLASVVQKHRELRQVIAPLESIAAPLQQAIAEAEAKHVSSPVAWLYRSIDEVVPTAVGILMGIVVTPLVVKTLLYFVIAPMATRRAPIKLLPAAVWQDSEVCTTSTNDPSHRRISDISQLITLNPGQELLIDPAYLLSSGSGSDTDTKWLLDWSSPMSCIAAGLFGLTRIRTRNTDAILVSAAKDPLAEIGVISLANGSALVVQPRRLVGVVQENEHPVRISKHWVLDSLNAWLTLQLRYLVFHGPVKLIVAGFRGVSVESARKGRYINQAATIGFSANLAYSTTRSGPFGAYLMGKQELFNDSFDGGMGVFVYEELPHAGKTTGLFGRGIDGLSDSLLKVIGI